MDKLGNSFVMLCLKHQTTVCKTVVFKTTVCKSSRLQLLYTIRVTSYENVDWKLQMIERNWQIVHVNVFRIFFV